MCVCTCFVGVWGRGRPATCAECRAANGGDNIIAGISPRRTTSDAGSAATIIGGANTASDTRSANTASNTGNANTATNIGSANTATNTGGADTAINTGGANTRATCATR